jgi:hypothetical protein
LAADVLGSGVADDRARLGAILRRHGAAKKCLGDDYAEFHHHGTDLSPVGALGL